MGEYGAFISKMHHKLGLDLTCYKEAQMKRRLTSLRNKRGFATFDAYYHALNRENNLLEEFIDRITINVSEFYRNPRRWQVLTETIMPMITKQKKQITIWSAACSTGEEAYSLAMLCHDHFKNIKVSIIATDIDDKILLRAKQGIYKPNALKELPDDKKSKYFMLKDNYYYVDEHLKKMITFKKHNLLHDPYPNNVDLIVCRNVLIYFTDEAKEMIYHKFGRALGPGGILFVGSTEQIFNPAEFQLSLYDTFFYQKTINE